MNPKVRNGKRSVTDWSDEETEDSNQPRAASHQAKKEELQALSSTEGSSMLATTLTEDELQQALGSAGLDDEGTAT